MIIGLVNYFVYHDIINGIIILTCANAMLNSLNPLHSLFTMKSTLDAHY